MTQIALHPTRSKSASAVTRLALSLTVLAIALLTPSLAQAQIKEPGNHVQYSLEIEPHLVFAWEHQFADDAGIGPGVRFNIPFLDNGPIDTINNNMAIGFGLDWAHYGDCDRGWGRRGWDWDDGWDCSGNAFIFPVVLQWNFFLTERISVFGEPGLAIAHQTVSVEGPGFEGDDSDTDVWFTFWGGARFLITESVSFTARIGHPYLSLGASFLM